MGKDILSSTPGLVFFQNKSWVSDYGTYYANIGKFVAKKDVEVPDSYVSNINKIVANRINMSKLIIENNGTTKNTRKAGKRMRKKHGSENL